MKKTISLFLILFIVSLVAQTPDWVQAIKEGRAIQDAEKYYFGIGVGNSFKNSVLLPFVRGDTALAE